MVSIHAPRTGRDSATRRQGYVRLPFQSTRPARGATRFLRFRIGVIYSFNPRAPHGARHVPNDKLCPDLLVSIHAPRTGRDELVDAGVKLCVAVSIHAPRTGRDHLVHS